MTPLCIHPFALVYCGFGEGFLFPWVKGALDWAAESYIHVQW